LVHVHCIKLGETSEFGFSQNIGPDSGHDLKLIIQQMKRASSKCGFNQNSGKNSDHDVE
jgi:hypothetical protein